jgi:hypothetical protein
MEPTVKNFTLPVSGLEVAISNRRLKVRDNDHAFQLVGPDAIKSPVKLMAARVSLTTTKADGSPILFEDILDWDEEDMNAVIDKRDDPSFFLTPVAQS